MSPKISFVEKMLKSFRNLREDAVPRPPRPVEIPRNQEPASSTQEPASSTYVPKPEEIFIDPNIEFEENTKPFKSEKQERNNRGNCSYSSYSGSRAQHSNGPISIVNNNRGDSITVFGDHIQIGNTIIVGSTMVNNPRFNPGPDSGDNRLSKHVKRVMEAKIKPDVKYLHHVAHNLKNWENFVEYLGFSEDEIDEMLSRCRTYGPHEACYKLLLEWVDISAENNLGRLANCLWQKEERKIVEKLAKFYEADLKL